MALTEAVSPLPGFLRMRLSAGFRLGLTLILAPLVLIVVGAILFDHGIALDGRARLLAPSLDHPFGTDNVGRDLFERVLLGGQISLAVGVAVSVLATTIGLFLGLIAGFLRPLDAVIMRVTDGLLAIPGLLLAIALVAVAGSSLGNVIFAITITSIPGVTRLVRSIVLSLRDQTFVDAARMAGNGTLRIVFRHLLPITLGPLVVQATFICTAAIITEAYLSFIGAGTPPDMASWGNIIAEGRNYFRIAPWIVLIPSAFIAVTVLGINLIGDALRDALDPRPQ